MDPAFGGIPVAAPHPSNRTHPLRPYLPDAPDICPAPEGESPYHESTSSREEDYRTLWAILTMAVACVRDVGRAAGRTMDFSPESLAVLDDFVDGFPFERCGEQDAIVFVAETGAYFGTVLQMEFDGRWHPSPTYYFSALRIPTRSRGTIETSPFAAVVRRAIGRAQEASLADRFASLSKLVAE